MTTDNQCTEREAELPRGSSGDSGSTLVEVIVAILIMGTLAAGLLSMAALALTQSENQGHLSARTAEYAQDKMEQLLALSYSDANSNTTVIPTIATGGSGMALGGSSNPNAVVAAYVDYLDSDGKPLCPCSGTTVPAGWFYKRVWEIATPAGSTNLKQITVTAIVARSHANKIIPRATLTALRSRIGNE